MLDSILYILLIICIIACGILIHQIKQWFKDHPDEEMANGEKYIMNRLKALHVISMLFCGMGLLKIVLTVLEAHPEFWTH